MSKVYQHEAGQQCCNTLRRGGGCRKTASSGLVCQKCKLDCSILCKKEHKREHDALCDQLARFHVKAVLPAAPAPRTENKSQQSKDESDANFEKLMKEVANETPTLPVVAQKPQEPPLEEIKFFVKCHSPRQVHEAHIYSILAENIEKYRDFCKVLPDTEGLRLPHLEVHRPQAAQIESSYLKLVSLLQEIHAAGVICSDLKPEHVRQDKAGELFIIDFDYAYDTNRNTESGLSMAWCSVDQLTNQACHFVDDLEAACKIAKYWTDLKPVQIFEHQRDGLCAGVSKLALLLTNSATHWLDDHLRYIVSRSRTVGYAPTLYKNLARGQSMRFSCDDFKADFRSRQRNFELREKTHVVSTDVGDTKGQIVEQFVNTEIGELFEPNQEVNLQNFSFNQIFYDTDEKRELTEWDFVVCRQQGFLPQPRNHLNQTYPQVSGGEHLVGEIWKERKSLSNVLTKFAILSKDHRPIHTLYFIGYFLMISGGFVTEANGAQMEMSSQTLLKHALKGKLTDLSVVLAAGRVSFFRLQNLPVLTLIDQSASTIAGLQEKNRVLSNRVDHLEAELKAVKALLLAKTAQE